MALRYFLGHNANRVRQKCKDKTSTRVGCTVDTTREVERSGSLGGRAGLLNCSGWLANKERWTDRNTGKQQETY